MKTYGNYAPTARREFRAWKIELLTQAQRMGARVPKLYYAPGPQQMLTAGSMARALKAIAAAAPEQEFKQSFSAWWPKTAEDIRRYEVMPALHERINCRAFITGSNPVQFDQCYRGNSFCEQDKHLFGRPFQSKLI